MKITSQETLSVKPDLDVMFIKGKVQDDAKRIKLSSSFGIDLI